MKMKIRKENNKKLSPLLTILTGSLGGHLGFPEQFFSKEHYQSLIQHWMIHHDHLWYQYEPRYSTVQELLEIGTFNTQLLLSHLQMHQVLWSSYNQTSQGESMVLYGE